MIQQKIHSLPFLLWTRVLPCSTDVALGHVIYLVQRNVNGYDASRSFKCVMCSTGLVLQRFAIKRAYPQVAAAPPLPELKENMWRRPGHKTQPGPGRVAQLVGASSHPPKRLRVRSLVRGHTRGNQSFSLSLSLSRSRSRSLSFSLSRSLSLKPINISSSEDLKKIFFNHSLDSTPVNMHPKTSPLAELSLDRWDDRTPVNESEVPELHCWQS